MMFDKCNDQVTIYLGEDKTLNFRLTDDKTKNPFDLTSATEVIAIFPVSSGLPIQKKKSLNELVVVSAVGGRFDVALSSADTARLELGAVVAVEIRITIATLLTIVQIPQALNVVPSLFP